VTFRVGFTRDLRAADGGVRAEFGFGELLDAPGIEWDFLAERADPLTAELVAGFDAVVDYAAAVGAASLAPGLKLVAFLGVGIDRIDVDACTAAGVLVTRTPDATAGPMAAGALALVLMLAHRVPEKERLLRAGRFDARLDALGQGLEGRTLGIVGVGSIGGELARIAAPLGPRILGARRSGEPVAGVELVPLDELLARSDFVVLACPLTEETRHLLDARALALMKPTAYLVNVARGAVVDQRALVEALRGRRLAGAALDVFDPEPPAPDDPLLALDNVVALPHAVGLTGQLFRRMGESASHSVLDVAAGRVPIHAANKEARWSATR
jgi:D-3-phosphoglycerate dehydrogenase